MSRARRVAVNKQPFGASIEKRGVTGTPRSAARTLKYSSNPIFLLPSLSMALKKSSAASPRLLRFRALRSSAASISPLRSTSASSKISFNAKTSFLLYFFSVFVSSVLPIASRGGEARADPGGKRRLPRETSARLRACHAECFRRTKRVTDT